MPAAGSTTLVDPEAHRVRITGAYYWVCGTPKTDPKLDIARGSYGGFRPLKNLEMWIDLQVQLKRDLVSHHLVLVDCAELIYRLHSALFSV